MKRKIVAGNWKMNTDQFEAMKLASEVIHMVQDEVTNDAEVILIPPFVFLHSISQHIGKAAIALGAQNCSAEQKGAFTGEVSAQMLASVGVSYVLVGHSERRNIFGEGTEVLKQKLERVVENKMVPIYCCGEKLEERQAGNHFSIVKEQLECVFEKIKNPSSSNIIIAYEPVWAIGTGVTATAGQAEEMHQYIRKELNVRWGAVADDIVLLYGGSCNGSNARSLFSQKNVNGGLIGGASLKSREFTDIIKSF